MRGFTCLSIPVAYFMASEQDPDCNQVMHAVGSINHCPPRASHAPTCVLLIHCLRVIWGISIRKKKCHTTIIRMAKKKRISSILTQLHLSFFGHLIRMPDNRLPKQLLVLAPGGGKHAAGGQTRGWNDLVSKDLRLCHLLRTWREEDQEGVYWHATIKQSIALLSKQAKVNEKSIVSSRSLVQRMASIVTTLAVLS